mmetsp:Transcript_17936/g.26546  ORF Transcript_17936/g.26546 Transcript_17936/m.26546 type:complete len:878 (-) Transcript_17936:85-2718(-)
MSANEEDNINDITIVPDEESDDNEGGDGFNFESAMKVRKNLSGVFDRHASANHNSMAERIAHFENKAEGNPAAAPTNRLPPRPPSSKISTSTSGLSVSLRIRPLTLPKSSGSSTAATTVEIINPRSGELPTSIRTYPPLDSNAAKIVRKDDKVNGVKEYNFQQVFAPDTTQHEVYSSLAAPLVRSLFPTQDQLKGEKKLVGESALLFAYGITNAGKTYTMMGNVNDQKSNAQWGVIPRALQDIFARMEGAIKYDLHMSYIEIYNENVYDLLPKKEAPSFKPRANLKLRESRDGDIFVRGLAKHQLKDVMHGLHLANKAKSKRHTSSNNINADSSRSHCICQLELSIRNTFASSDNDGSSTTGYDTDEEAASISKKRDRAVKLWIVDLAGSERTKRTGMITGSARQKEATLINTSLMKLMRCLSLMREKQSHSRSNPVVPFRESKLTHLFMSHLTGPSAARTTMIVNINPAASDFDETQHVLSYAVAAKNIKITNHDYVKKQMEMGLVTAEYDMNGRKKHATGDGNNKRPSKIIRLMKKYSPKGKKQHSHSGALENAGSRKRKVELYDNQAKKRPNKITRFDSEKNLVKHTKGRDQASTLQKEMIDLKSALSNAQAEVQKLRLKGDQQAIELADVEETVRIEVSEEMERLFQQTREEYDCMIESLQNQLQQNPLGAKSEKKARMDRAEKMIEELVDKVDECEEEMVRMRIAHEEEIDQLKKEYQVALHEKDQEMIRLCDAHQLEMQELQRGKDELREQYERLNNRSGDGASDVQHINSTENGMEQSGEMENICPVKAEDSNTAVGSEKVPERNAPSRAPLGSIDTNSEKPGEESNGYLQPKKPPVKDATTGVFIRPSGRAPNGHEWDQERGAWHLSIL